MSILDFLVLHQKRCSARFLLFKMRIQDELAQTYIIYDHCSDSTSVPVKHQVPSHTGNRKKIRHRRQRKKCGKNNMTDLLEVDIYKSII